MGRMTTGEETASIVGAPRPGSTVCVTRLVIVHPRALAGVLVLGEPDTVLGRTTGAAGSCVVAHPTVSRNHAMLRWDASVGSHSVADLGSHNGTWLEGSPVRNLPRYLVDQAVLRLGDVLAVYERQDYAAVDPPEVSRDAVPGGSLAACALRSAVARAGNDPAPALIEGETGVGKEHIAAELHRLGGRRGPLVIINCAALSATVIESQLFGHTRGAFTGATHESPGLFRAAAGGTLFLDELGELPLELQPKLLRAVELGEVVAVGSTQRQQVDVRLVLATNRSLADEVARGRFRRDLHARVSLSRVPVPPLRARRADLLEWFDRLHRAWSLARGHTGVAAPELHTDAALALLLHAWPDNLRGLQRIVHGTSSPGPRDPISRAELQPWLSDAARLETPAPAALLMTPAPGTPAPAQPVFAQPVLAQPALAQPALAQQPSPTPRPLPPRIGSPRQLRPRPSREELVEVLTREGWSIRATAKHYGRERKQISRWLEMYAIRPLASPADDEPDDP